MDRQTSTKEVASKFLDLASYLEESYLKAPDSDLNSKKIQIFEETLVSAAYAGSRRMIDYKCEYPKYEFLNYLVSRKNVLLHGSNYSNIKILHPIRASIGTEEWMNLKAIYATSDAIRPIFYAISNRDSYRYSLADGCFQAPNKDGGSKKFYYFRLNYDTMRGMPWRSGMIYIIPRAPFEPLFDDGGNFVDEWVSKTSVKIVAKLPVTPEDFPFLHQVYVQREKFVQQDYIERELDEKVCDSYIGDYEYAPGSIIAITRKGGLLFIQATGYPKIRLYAKSDTEFKLFGLNAKVVFVREAVNRISGLILRFPEQDIHVRKIPETTSLVL